MPSPIKMPTIGAKVKAVRAKGWFGWLVNAMTWMNLVKIDIDVEITDVPTVGQLLNALLGVEPQPPAPEAK